MKINQIKRILFGVFAVISLSSCVVVKGYQRVNINDPDMALSAASIDKSQNKFQSYREAASGANGGKTGGGCGCN